MASKAAGRGHPACMPRSRAQPGPGWGPRGGHALAGRGADVPRDARRRAVDCARGRSRQRERRARGGGHGRDAERRSLRRGRRVPGAARQRPAARGAVLGHVRQRAGDGRGEAGAGRRGRARALWCARAARGRRAVWACVRGPDRVGAEQPGQPGVHGHATGRARAHAGGARRTARGGHPVLGDCAGLYPAAAAARRLGGRAACAGRRRGRRGRGAGGASGAGRLGAAGGELRGVHGRGGGGRPGGRLPGPAGHRQRASAGRHAGPARTRTRARAGGRQPAAVRAG